MYNKTYSEIWSLITRYNILKIVVFPYTKGQGLILKCMGITHETMKLSNCIHIKIQRACALIYANTLWCVCVVVVVLNVNPTSLDYLLLPLNEHAVISEI